MNSRIFFIIFLILINFISVYAKLQAQNCSVTSVGFIPINDLGTSYYRNFQGGLYPNGSNQRPVSHNIDGTDIARKMLPLDTAGNTNISTGKIVLLSVGMSNCSQEFLEFRNQNSGASYLNPKVVFINGAQGGQVIDSIINPNAIFWSNIKQFLAAQGLTEKQVQAVWFKEAQIAPTDTSFPGYPVSLKNKYKTAIGIMKGKYKNLKLCYNASRIYAGYATIGLNPEPYAYYSGWTVKWLIEDQINGDTSLNYKGANPNSPWLSWGPYLWADGVIPRSDGLTWVCPADFNTDGTHPSIVGRAKVATMLTNFFKTDETTKPWFIKNFTLYLYAAIQGFYDSAINRHRMRDTMSIHVRNINSPYSSVDSAISVIDSVSLLGIFKFYNLVSGTYYFQLKHRNNVETWSKTAGEPVTFGGISEYSFLTSQSKAYGNNQTRVDDSPVLFATYSGDVNQDGAVDLSDITNTYNDAFGFISGYVSTDVNGDSVTDLGDLVMVFNNANGFVQKVTP